MYDLKLLFRAIFCVYFTIVLIQTFKLKIMKRNNLICLKSWFWIFVPSIFWVFGACSIQNIVNRDDYKVVPKNFTGNFYDKLDTLQNNYDNKISTTSLIKRMANIDNVQYSRPIQMHINDKELFLNFEDIYGKRHVLKFHGKRYKNKFVFYTNYETVSFPIVFMTKEMTKYSVYLPNDTEIIFEKHNVNEGMLLLFGAGNSYKSDNKFKLLPNE